MGSLSRLGTISGRYLNVFAKQPHHFRYTARALLHTSSYFNVQGQEIKMPSLSPTMEEGTIVKWLKKEGDAVAPGDVLCDIQTDKAVVSMETDEEGILAKILVPEDTKDIKVGTLIALMVPEGEDWKAVELPSGSAGAGGAPSTGKTATESVAEEAPAASGPAATVINMPSLSPTMSEGTIIKWLKKEGDTVAPGDVLCDIQTDKAVMSMETEEEGILAKILLPDDTKDVKIGIPIALIVAEGEDWKSVVVPRVGAAAPAAAPKPKSPSAAPTLKSSASASKGAIYGPAVRSLLEIYQIDASSVSATGRKNMLLKSDVLQYISTNGLQKKAPKAVKPPAAAATAQTKATTTPQAKRGDRYIDIELSNVRKVIAKRLTQSKQEIPHSYGSVQCNIGKLLAFRKKLKEDGIKVSVNDIVIRAAASALELCPEVNAIYRNQLEPVPDVDISVAVATDNGLITPIVKGANKRTLADISKTVQQLAGKAREGKLQPAEFQGGSFTISNLGMFGITEFSAIINPPQVAILAVGGPISRLDAALVPQTHLRATLSFDGRALTDPEAARFLATLRQFLEDPQLILSGVKPQSLQEEQETPVAQQERQVL